MARCPKGAAPPRFRRHYAARQKAAGDRPMSALQSVAPRTWLQDSWINKGASLKFFGTIRGTTIIFVVHAATWNGAVDEGKLPRPADQG